MDTTNAALPSHAARAVASPAGPTREATATMSELDDATVTAQRWFATLGDGPSASARTARAGELGNRMHSALRDVIGPVAADAWALLLARPLRTAVGPGELTETAARTATVLAAVSALLGDLAPAALVGASVAASDSLAGTEGLLERIALGATVDAPAELFAMLRPTLRFDHAALVAVAPQGVHATVWSVCEGPARDAFVRALDPIATLAAVPAGRVETAPFALLPGGPPRDGVSDSFRVVAVPLAAQGEVSTFVVFDVAPAADLVPTLRFATAAVQLLAPRLRVAASADPWRGQLLSVISHDLRNPLSAILMSVSLLLRGRRNLAPEERNEVDRQLDVIKRSGERMNQLIQNLLDAVTLDQHPLEIYRNPCEIPWVVTEAMRSAQVAATSKGVRLETSVDPAVASISGDRERLVQCISNLTVTAVKLVGRGGVVTVQVVDEGDGIARFMIAQSGPGLSSEDALRLFERASWAGRDSRIGAGTGLGLTVARGIVQAHGGSLEVLGGDTVTFTFALARDVAPATTPPDAIGTTT